MENYVSFLYNNHLNEISELCIKKFYEEDQIFSFTNFCNKTVDRNELEKEAEKFLRQVIEHKTLDEITEVLSDLKSKRLACQTTLSEIVPVFHNRKNVLYFYLPQYTSKPEEITRIVREIEETFYIQELFAIKNLGEFQKQIGSEGYTFTSETELQSHQGHCTLDYFEGTVKCSEEVYDMLGLDRTTNLTFDLLRDLTISENGFVPFSDKPIQQYKDDTPELHEFRMRKPGQKIVSVLSADFPVKGNDGTVRGLRRVMSDVTSRKEMEEKIADAGHLLTKILENSPSPIVIYDIVEDKLVSGNNAFFNLFSKAGIDFTTSHFSTEIDRLIHPQDREELTHRLKEIHYPVEDKYPDLSLRLILEEGNTYWLNTTAIVFKRESGSVKHLLVIASDITTSKQTEEKLRLSEENLRESEKIACTGSYDWDIEKGTSVISEGLIDIYGLAPGTKSFFYNEFRNLLRPDHIAQHDESMKQLFNGTIDSNEDEFTIVMSDKREKHLLHRSRILRDYSGKPKHLTGRVIDITYLKESEKRLQEKNLEIVYANTRLQETLQELENVNSELEERIRFRTQELKESKELYQTFFEQNAVGVWRFEFSGGAGIDTAIPVNEQIQQIINQVFIAEANQQLAGSLGLKSVNSLIGRRISDFLLISDDQKSEILRDAILSGYRLDEREISARSLQGTWLHVEISIIGILEDQKLMRGWGIVRNVTDRKLAVDALMVSEERYRFLAESVPHIVWTAQANGNIEYVNQRWYKYTGDMPDEHASVLNWLPYIHPDDVSKTIEAWRECLVTGNVCQIEFRLRRADGKYRWQLAIGLPFKSTEGDIVKWMGTTTDIEDQKVFTNILEEKNKDLEMVNSDLDNFIYTVSHDLKAPIANIQSLSRTLESELTEECKKQDDIGEIFKMLDVSIDKFKNNLIRLIEIAMSEKNSSKAYEENQLPEILEEVNFLLQDQIKKSEATITVDFSACSVIKFPRRNLQSIIYNLVSNAIKYRSTLRKPKVFIRTENLQEYILLSVQDNGLGFEPEQLEKVFSQFKRLHKEIEGSGVGLYLIKRIINNAGGRIEVESEAGKGSVFKVYFKKV